MVALISRRVAKTARLEAQIAIILATIATMTVAVVAPHLITAITAAVVTAIGTVVAVQVARMSKSRKYLRMMS
jgi:Flp pilus assembly protein TadB